MMPTSTSKAPGRRPKAARQRATAVVSPLNWYRLGPTDRIGVLRQGVPSSLVTETEARMHLSRQVLCRMMGLPVSTIQRRLTQKASLSLDESERLMGLHQLIGQVEAMVDEGGDPAGFDAGLWLADWLNRPNPALGQAPPADFLDTAEGRQLVSRLLGMMRSGAYA